MNKNATERACLIRSFARQLNDNEIDALKYRISLEAAKIISDEGVIDQKNTARFNLLLESLVEIHSYKDRIPEYGLAYKGRPNFMSERFLDKLLLESEQFQPNSYKNLDQYIYQVETPKGNTYAEKLATSEELYQLVTKYAGASLQSFVTNYLYYNKKGQHSRPHVDNAFTSITAMVGLKQTSKVGNKCNLSSSFIYWPNKPRFNYQLKPGEIAIFFGAAVLHGRTKIGESEETSSLLISFRPSEV